MLRRQFGLSVMAALVAIFVSTAAHAAVIYDEALDGDAPGVVPGAIAGSVESGSSSILGSLDGGLAGGPPGPDETDIFLFAVNGDWTADLTTLSGVDVVIFLVGGPTGDFIDASGPGTNIFGTLVEGLYTMNVVPSGNSGIGSYQIDLNLKDLVTPVPLPAALPLFGGALAVMALFGWRRKRTV